MKIEFKTKNQKQLEAVRYWIDNTTEQILYGGAKVGGKSFLGVSLIFGDALIYPQTHYFIARKELNDLRKYTIPTVHEVTNEMAEEYYAYMEGRRRYLSFASTVTMGQLETLRQLYDNKKYMEQFIQKRDQKV